MEQELSTAASPTVDAMAVDHTGIAVHDLDAAVAFYTSAMGLVEVHREVNTEQQVTEAMLATAAEQRDPAPAPPPARLQLLTPTSPESAIARFLQRSGPGLHHIAYRVNDVEAAATALRQRGNRLLYATGRPGTSDSVINFIHPKDTGGTLIELVQPARIAR